MERFYHQKILFSTDVQVKYAIFWFAALNRTKFPTLLNLTALSNQNDLHIFSFLLSFQSAAVLTKRGIGSVFFGVFLFFVLFLSLSQTCLSKSRVASQKSPSPFPGWKERVRQSILEQRWQSILAHNPQNTTHILDCQGELGVSQPAIRKKKKKVFISLSNSCVQLQALDSMSTFETSLQLVS